ncbi:pollen-specific leucine-rich repeat extensin-like protein 3 [Belonocnema kinseyi]|uniref:pollen-specific leucine-rich repeat extensin-like protein 3 n=1 Tax=Belonocnema kinseyi TaxID=2817044 RepID=UPI00143DE63B|nr:pollen-specific leucine-rich repeat extensin-like protein 3 [Belonocnema kinseyi]
MGSYQLIFAFIFAIKFAINVVPSSAANRPPSPPDDYDDYPSDGDRTPLAPHVVPPSAHGVPARPPSIHSNQPLEPNESFPPTPQGSPPHGNIPRVPHGHGPPSHHGSVVPSPRRSRPPSLHGSVPPSPRGSRTPSYHGSGPPSLQGSVPPSPGRSGPPYGHGPPVPYGHGPPSAHGSGPPSPYGSGAISPYGERGLSPYGQGELAPVREPSPPRTDKERGEFSFGFWNPHERHIRPDGHVFCETPEWRFCGPTGTHTIDVMLPSPTGERITRIEFISKQGVYSEGEEVQIVGHTRNVDLVQARIWSKPHTEINFTVKFYTHD